MRRDERGPRATYLVDVRWTECFRRSNVGLENIQDVADDLGFFQAVDGLLRFDDDGVPDVVGQLHVLVDQFGLLNVVNAGGDHVTNGFVERMYLVWFQVADDAVDVGQDLVDERLRFAQLNGDEVASAFLSDFDECIARHVLNTFVRFVHEFE